MTSSPTPPIDCSASDSRFDGPGVDVPEEAVRALESICEVITDGRRRRRGQPRLVAARDCTGRLPGEVPQLADVVVRPTSTDEVVACRTGLQQRAPAAHRRRAAAAACAAPRCRCSAAWCSTPPHSQASSAIDEISGVVEVLPGTFGPDLEDALASGRTVGRPLPAEFRSRNRRRVDRLAWRRPVLAPATARSRTWWSASRSSSPTAPSCAPGGAPAAAAGPDLTQLFVGCEGTLGVITRVWLRTHPIPGSRTTWRRTAFASFGDGIEACRRILQTRRHAGRPAPLRRARVAARPGRRRHRVHPARARRGRRRDRRRHDGDRRTELHAPSAQAGRRRPGRGVARTTATTPRRSRALTRKGFVVDTMEIAASWSMLDELFDDVRAAMLAVPHARAATCHLSHSYADGACLYFTFAATPPADEIESTYIALWDAGSERCSPAAATCRTTTAWASTAAASWPRPSARRYGVLVGDQGDARPERHHEPGQARPAHAVRRGPVALNASCAAMGSRCRSCRHRRVPDLRDSAHADRRVRRLRRHGSQCVLLLRSDVRVRARGRGARRGCSAVAHRSATASSRRWWPISALKRSSSRSD